MKIINNEVIINNQLILIQCKSITKRKRKTYITKIREGRVQVYNALQTIENNENKFKELFDCEFNEILGLIVTLSNFPIKRSIKRGACLGIFGWLVWFL